MSMYVDVLSGALDAWDSELSGGALVNYVVDCRSTFLASGGRGHSALATLAAEVAYDRALIALCSDLGIAVSATDFAQPHKARQRAEQALARSRGLDLVSLSRGHPRP